MTTSRALFSSIAKSLTSTGAAVSCTIRKVARPPAGSRGSLSSPVASLMLEPRPSAESEGPGNVMVPFSSVNFMPWTRAPAIGLPLAVAQPDGARPRRGQTQIASMVREPSCRKASLKPSRFSLARATSRNVSSSRPVEYDQALFISTARSGTCFHVRQSVLKAKASTSAPAAASPWHRQHGP